MSCGNEFVETLKKIGYAKSDNLNGEDFDWLFETVENKPFLEWFCRNVNEQQVLTEKELEAFSTLQKSGKPILEEQALDEVLKTCQTSDRKTSSLEEIELEKLETELQALQKLKNLKIQRRNKFQLILSANSHRSLQLNAKEEEATKNLKESQVFLNAVNTKICNQLQDLINGVDKLTSFFDVSETKQGTAPPVFLSQLALKKYLSQEGQSTVALTSYTKKHFFQGIQDLVESSNEENFQLFDIKTPSTCDAAANESHEERRLEMARLRLAYICAQHQLIHLKANECSLQSRIKWAEETLQTLASKAIGKEDLEAKMSSFSSEILKLEEQITQLNNKTLPAVVKENAQLLNMPVVKGDFDLQLAKQDYYTSRQELVLNQLIKQKASFELLQLAYEIELRKHRDTHRQLESLTQELSQSNNVLHQRLEMLADPSISQQTLPRNTIDTKDCSTHRLYQLLEGENKKQELFRTYEGLAEVAQKLKQDVSSVRDQLAIAAQEHSIFLSKLNNGVDMLCDTLYCGGNQLYLSDQELKEQFHQVDSHLKKLNHLLMDILANVKAKRRILATDKLHQMERELYVYFFKDKEYLKKIVENLEHQIYMKNMENYEGNVGFDLSKKPLSNVAQRIMAAMHSYDLVEIKKFRENEKNEKMVHYSSVKDTLLEDKSPHYVTVTDQSPKVSNIISLQSAGIRHLNQMSNVKDCNSSESMPLISCVIPSLNFKPSHLQKKEIKKEYFLKENNSIEKKDAKKVIKRKHAAVSHLSKQTKSCFTMQEFQNGIETKYQNSGETKAPENPVCDVRSLGTVEKSQLMEKLKQATALVVTMIYQDGSSQLKHDKDLNSLVKGIIILIKSTLDNSSHPFSTSNTDVSIMDEFTKDDRYIYIKIEHDTLWRQEQEMSNQFARTVLFQILKCKYTVVCFNAKEFVKTVLQVCGSYGHWKHVADFMVLDPRIAAWLLDPSDTISSFEDLVRKYCEEPVTMKMNNTSGGSSHNMVNLCSHLRILYRLTVDLCSKLKVCGLWQLFYTLELPLIPILAVMETHKIQVNKEEMKRTSKLLGFCLKELEKKAHVAAGEQFLVTSNNQLREVLFDKLKLHLLCKSKTVPKTELQKHPSTSEATLNALQDLHPLPKIILEYRQGFIASTWNQTGTVSGRLSAKKPNIQGISKHPIQITIHQCEQGKEDEKTTISPRTMFISSKGYTFLAADFSQIELRILAHLSCDPELLKLFQEPESLDVFVSLTSQWKGIPLEQVTHVEREQTKRVVYSVVYGAGKERLATCLGVTALQASQFIGSFLQKYKKIHDFTQETIMQCHHKGYVVSIMGRRRPLPNINAKDYRLRTQAERQAVNFVVQGSAADLCKMAMIKLFSSIATSPKLTARLLAQIHDELLFEVEDSQIPEFAALVKETMESLRNIQAMQLHLKVPLKVNLATGRSWGCLSPFREAAPGAAQPGRASFGH